MLAKVSPSKAKRGRILYLVTQPGCLTVPKILASDNASNRTNHFQRRLLVPHILFTDKFARLLGLEVLVLSRLLKSRSVH